MVIDMIMAKDVQGMTALSYATSSGSMEIIKIVAASMHRCIPAGQVRRRTLYAKRMGFTQGTQTSVGAHEQISDPPPSPPPRSSMFSQRLKCTPNFQLDGLDLSREML